MISTVQTVAFNGIDVLPVSVQTQIAAGLPAFTIVGLPDKAVAESKERVRAAFNSLGFALPPKRITINLAPADISKEGSHFDLAIAAGLLASLDILPKEELSHYTVLGELGLDGGVMPVAGVLPSAISANAMNKGLICPEQQGCEAAWSGLDDILAVDNLLALINHFKGTQILPKPKKSDIKNSVHHLDLKEIKGQESAKRALEITAAGGHNMIMVGPPGTGKSMLASRLPSILPPLSAEEALETSMIHSIAGQLKDNKIVSDRPFRDPHHSASTPALVGGGRKANPGEISLSHNGVLFLDELPEFQRSTLEALRQPVETGHVSVSRVNSHVKYPANFQLIAAMNPCKCGYLGNHEQECNRAPKCALDYQSKISGPLFDRIDIHIDVPQVNPWELANIKEGENSETVRKRVLQARDIQSKRFIEINKTSDKKYRTNNDLSGKLLETFAKPDIEGEKLLIQAAQKMQLSARAYHRTLKVARTIADLENTDQINKLHIAEALSYRRIIPGKSAILMGK